LHLGCMNHSPKQMEWMREMARNDPQLHLRSPPVRMAHCASEKIDVDWNVFYGAAERAR
jgi:hypothetical protein